MEKMSYLLFQAADLFKLLNQILYGIVMLLLFYVLLFHGYKIPTRQRRAYMRSLLKEMAKAVSKNSVPSPG
ncbi:MAG: hypothetical protein A2098_02575 [Chlamydiae bacterium GWF2_49_8]|nr:MAG: hypothetical protein A2098_02575 [Chlamydiae bacterium GWF2_49_8]